MNMQRKVALRRRFVTQQERKHVMSQATLKSRPLIASLFGGAVLLLLALSLSVFTQAQGQKNEKKATLKDAIERLGPNQIRAKSGFTLIAEEGGWAVEQVVGRETRRLEARVKCGACPGGNCRSRLNGTCAPRTSCTSSSCLIDPF